MLRLGLGTKHTWLVLVWSGQTVDAPTLTSSLRGLIVLTAACFILQTVSSLCNSNEKLDNKSVQKTIRRLAQT